MKSKTLFGLLLASVLCFMACDGGNEPNRDEQINIINAVVKNGNDYNNLIDKVAATYRIYEGDYNLYTLLTVDYKNGGFEMTLPETLGSNALQSITNLWNKNEAISVSNEATKICVLQTNFDAYKDGELKGSFGNVSSTSTSQFVGYAYVDRDCDVTGEATSGDLVIYEMYFKKGWNLIYFNIYENEQGEEAEYLTTTKPATNFVWRFFGNDDEEEGETENKKEVKMVSTISVPYMESNMEFTYDEQNRIVELKNYFGIFGEGKKATFTYVDDTMIMKAGFTGQMGYEDREPENFDGEIEYTAQLTPEGYIQSAVSIYKNLRTNEESTTYWTASYTDGYITRLLREDHTNRSTDFVWRDGNLIKARDLDIEYYSELKNNAVNPDINWIVNIAYWTDYLEEMILPQFGFYGKRSENLIKSVTSREDGRQGQYPFKYTFDQSGYVKTCALIAEGNDDSYQFEFEYK